MAASLSRHHRQGGYILVATLALLALMTLIAARLAFRVDSLREQAAGFSGYVDARVAAEGAKARVLFRMAVEPTSYFGFGLDPVTGLIADGRAMPLPGGVSAALQDHRGLLSLNAPDRGALGRLLVQAGLDDGQAQHLLDCLEDYTDTDSLHRLNGADTEDYLRQGLPPPRNDWLASAEELRDIIGWRELGPRLDRFIPLLSSRRDGLFNPNAAPRELLAARFPLAPPEQIEMFLARRALAPFHNAVEARALTGLPFDDETDLFHASDFYRLVIRLGASPLAFEYNLRLTPDGLHAPWQIVDSRAISLPLPLNDAKPAPETEKPAAAGPR